MGKIATEQEARNIGGKGTATNNKCATKSKAQALGCNVKGSYKDNQLVQLNDLSKAYEVVRVNISWRPIGIAVGDRVNAQLTFTVTNGEHTTYARYTQATMGTTNIQLYKGLTYNITGDSSVSTISPNRITVSTTTTINVTFGAL